MGFYIVDKQNDELKHYGVIGMKWGIRRAKKNNTSYVYRSYGQKRYEKKLAAAKTKNADKKQLASTSPNLILLRAETRHDSVTPKEQAPVRYL